MRVWKKMAALFAVATFLLLSLSACNLFMSDDEVLQEMMSKMATLQSSSSESMISGSVMVDEVPTVDFDVKMTGNALSPKVLEGEDVLSAAFEYNLKANLNAQGQRMSLDADMKMLNENMYFRLNSLPLIPVFDLSDIMQKWFSLNLKDLGEYNGQATAIDFSDLMNYAYELYEDSNFFSIKDDLGTSKVGNHKVYHYSVSIDKEAMTDMLMKLALKVGEGQELSEDDLAEAREEMIAVLETLNIKNIELFIDKDDFYLRRMIMDMEIVAPAGELGVGGSFFIKMDAVYDNFNKAIEISAPEGAENLETLFNSLMGPSMLEPAMDLSDADLDKVDLDELSEEDQAMLDEFLLENPEIKLEE